MRFKRRKRSQAPAILTVAGVALAGAAAAYAVVQVLKSGPVTRRREMLSLERRVLQALLEDEIATNQGIDIAAVGIGVVELSGAVETQSAARHVIELVDRLPGVRAVVNRFEILEHESRLRRNRSRVSTGGTRWYGGSAGIGRRRQGIQTEPPQRDDHTEMLERALQPNRDDALTELKGARVLGAPPPAER